MSVISSRNIQIQFSGDADTKIIRSALDNIVSPGDFDIVSLVLGNNTITPPSVSGVVTTALTIIPPAGNISLMILKGNAADVGIPLHLTDPTSIALDTTFVSLVLNAAAAIIGVRLIWS